jgi:hypothetical protein
MTYVFYTLVWDQFSPLRIASVFPAALHKKALAEPIRVLLMVLPGLQRPVQRGSGNLEGL